MNSLSMIFKIHLFTYTFLSFCSDVRSNILKRQRITLVRLSELNLIRKKEFDIIIQYIELALNSAELKVPYKHFLELFNIDVSKSSSFRSFRLTSFCGR